MTMLGKNRSFGENGYFGQSRIFSRFIFIFFRTKNWRKIQSRYHKYLNESFRIMDFFLYHKFVTNVLNIYWAYQVHRKYNFI